MSKGATEPDLEEVSVDVLATEDGFEEDARVGVEKRRRDPIAVGAGIGAVKSTLVEDEVGAETEAEEKEEGPTESGTGRETEANGL